MLDNKLYRILTGSGYKNTELVEWSGVHEGQEVLELGPAAGYFPPALSKTVGKNGKIYSIDVQAEMIAKLQDKVERLGLRNVSPLVAGGETLPLADDSVDSVCAFYVLEEVVDLESVVSEFHRVLRPGGNVTVTQVAYDFKQHQKDAMRHIFPTGGFELLEESDGRWTYKARWRRTSTS